MIEVNLRAKKPETQKVYWTYQKLMESYNIEMNVFMVKSPGPGVEIVVEGITVADLPPNVKVEWIV